MATVKKIVSKVAAIDPSPREPTDEFLRRLPFEVSVQFEDGQTARIRPADSDAAVYLEVLQELAQRAMPAYVEVNEATQITRVLVPIEGAVLNLSRRVSGDIEVNLEISQAVHVVRRVDRNFNQLLDTLQRALESGTQVLITEGDNGIIDVRVVQHPTHPAVRRARPGDRTLATPNVSPQQARRLYALVRRQSCDPVSVAIPCIPFRYPDDGCWGRAHEMSRLILDAGGLAGKVWIYGTLRASTRNNPNCFVAWNWHVAPTLQTEFCLEQQLLVIDPSLFGHAVTEDCWKEVQGDPDATLVHTDASVFYRSATGALQFDPTYAETARVLATYRLKLRLRSTSSVGPPPYYHCDEA